MDYKFAIIGAGFSGLGMGIRLKQAGIDSFVIFERAAELGGTWRDNTYPGCACDIPSIVYSFSFDQNPDWSQWFPSQPEILAYLKQSVKRFEIESHIRYNADVCRAEFDESAEQWQLTTTDGQAVTAQIVVSAFGPLNRPNIPDLPGLDQFAGPAFHSSMWNHNVDLSGKRVVSIGTGASAIQYIPEIAPHVEQLTVFQRTPAWIMPRGDFELSDFHKTLFRRLPFLQHLRRGLTYLRLELGVFGFLGNVRLRRLGAQLSRGHLATQVPDAALREKLTPRYEMGCKRVLVSDDFYPAMQRDNVTLVTDGIREVTADGVIDNDDVLHAADVLVFGTGFVASEIDLEIQILGRNKRNLFDEWRVDGPEAYYGLSVSGYPNLFFLLGPNTGLGHNSVLLMIESQHNYIMDYVRLLERRGVRSLDIDAGRQMSHNVEIQEKLNGTVWQNGRCNSWYQTRAGKNTTIWPGTTFGYRRITRTAHPDAYR